MTDHWSPGNVQYGKVWYKTADGNQVFHPCEYDKSAHTYRIRGAHGYVDPWTLGGAIAATRGSAIVEMYFHNDDTLDTDELYIDRDHLWTIDFFGKLISRMAPVHWHELRQETTQN